MFSHVAPLVFSLVYLAGTFYASSPGGLQPVGLPPKWMGRAAVLSQKTKGPPGEGCLMAAQVNSSPRVLLRVRDMPLAWPSTHSDKESSSSQLGIALLVCSLLLYCDDSVIIIIIIIMLGFGWHACCFCRSVPRHLCLPSSKPPYRKASTAVQITACLYHNALHGMLISLMHKGCWPVHGM